MLNVAVFIFLALTSLNPNGIQSQPTIEDDGYEDWRLKLVEAEMRQQSSEAAWGASVERLEQKLTICEEHCRGISLIKRLNQSSSSTTMKYHVNGVTKHEDRIYILCGSPNSIRAFEDRNPFPLLYEVQLTQIGTPYDFVYDDRLQCFFVADFSNECVWKVTISEGNQVGVTKWLNSTYWPNTLSLSSDGHLLVLTSYATSTRSKLDIYNGSDTRLHRHIELNRTIEQARHAIQTKAGEFLISHVHMLENEQGTWVISRVTRDGQTIIAQSNSSNNSERLDWPWHLALDSDNNRLFVADHHNGRVVLFQSDSLCFRQILLTGQNDGIQTPRRIHYDKKKRQLIVGHYSNINYNDGGVVDVYQVYETK